MLVSLLGEELTRQGLSIVIRDYAAEELAAIRNFLVSELNLECDDYPNIINWSKVVVTKSQVTRTLSDIINKKKLESHFNVDEQRLVQYTMRLVPSFKTYQVLTMSKLDYL